MHLCVYGHSQRITIVLQLYILARLVRLGHLVPDLRQYRTIIVSSESPQMKSHEDDCLVVSHRMVRERVYESGKIKIIDISEYYWIERPSTINFLSILDRFCDLMEAHCLSCANDITKDSLQYARKPHDKTLELAYLVGFLRSA